MEIKKRGSISLFAIVIITFISWIIFSASFLLNEEILILKDDSDIRILNNNKNYFENIFKIYLNSINFEIENNDQFNDIIDYVSKKNGDFIFLNNYSSEVETDSNFKITKIYTRPYCELGKTYDFKKNKNSFKYVNILKNQSTSKIANESIIVFEKKINDIFIENHNQDYTFVIVAKIEIKYGSVQDLKKTPLAICRLKEVNFNVHKL